jgi:hypothetical protein
MMTVPKESKMWPLLVRFLAVCSTHSPRNKMTPKNLAIVFAPNLLKPKEEVCPPLVSPEIKPSLHYDRSESAAKSHQFNTEFVPESLLNRTEIVPS